jgi:precorrin-2/cobalt-factor-2 C20-methyltransferase
MSGTLIGVGVGPGDPELLTVQALRVIREADRVVAPALAPDAVGRAEAIVRQVAPDVRVERVVFDMGPAADERAAAYDRAVLVLLPRLDAGERVVFITLGDPNIYSTFSSLATAVRRLRPAVAVETVPGIMAFQALAARAGTVLLEGTQSMRLVTALEGAGALEEALGEDDHAVVVYKGGRHLPDLLKALARAGRSEGAVIGELLGLPGERVAAAGEWPEQPASYLATLIVPPAR